MCRVGQKTVFLRIFPIYSTFLVKFTTLQTGSPKKKRSICNEARKLRRLIVFFFKNPELSCVRKYVVITCRFENYTLFYPYF